MCVNLSEDFFRAVNIGSSNLYRLLIKICYIFSLLFFKTLLCSRAFSSSFFHCDGAVFDQVGFSIA